MAVMISTNAFVKASFFFDESRETLRKPAFPQARFNRRRIVTRKSKTNVIFCLNLSEKDTDSRTGSSDGGFEFKPSFDQYLQIMESVKTARKKKKIDRLLVDKVDDGGGDGDSVDSLLRNRVSDKRLVLRSDVEDVKSKSGELKDGSFRRRYIRQETVSNELNQRVFTRNEESGAQRLVKDVKWSKSDASPEDESFRGRHLKQEMVRNESNQRVFTRNEESGAQRLVKDVKWSKSDASPEDESFRGRHLKQEMVRNESNQRVFTRNEESGAQRLVKDVKWSKSDASPEDESFRGRHLKQEMVRNESNQRVFTRNEESGAQRLVKDVKWSKSDASPEDESFRGRHLKQEMVRNESNQRVFKGNEESGAQRVTKDVKWSKSDAFSEDDSFRGRYLKQEMVRNESNQRVFKRNEESGAQRITKDVKWSKSDASSVTYREDENFRGRYMKQDTVRHHHSSYTPRGSEEKTKVDELDLVVGERRSITNDEKWSKSGEASGIAQEDTSFGGRYSKQEIVKYQRSYDTPKEYERGCERNGLDLLAEERRIERLANERLLSNKLSRTMRMGGKNDDADDDLFDMETPAFRFSDESSEVVDKPPTSRAEMEDRIEKLAKVLNGADINMPEWQFSKAIRSAKIRYNDFTIMRLIHFLGKLGNWRRVLQVIEWLQRQERYKSNKLRIIYTTALNVLGKSKRPVEALNVFHAMLLQISSYPDMVAYRSIAVTLGQAGHVKELFHVIDTMRSPPKKKFKPTTLVKWDPRFEPDVVVYNAVLNACVQRKQWEGAFWVLQQLKQRGQKPSPVTYGLVMEVMYACEKYNLVHEFFRKMQKSSIPNALAYRVIVNTLWKEGKTDEAIQTVEDMESRGIVGSAALYYDLARCLCSAGRCNEGLNMIKKLCRVANKPLVVTYTGLIQACLDSGNVKDAAYIFDQMKEICNPNLVTCNIMLKAYLQDGLFEEARELFQNMSEDRNHLQSSSDYDSRVLPDTYTFNTMLDACAEKEKWDNFGYAYLEMLRHGYHFNAKRHLKMVLKASREGKEEVMEATWEHLRRSKRIPPSPLIKERFCRKLEKGDHVSAISSLAVLNGNINEAELRAFSTTAWSKVMVMFEKDSVLRLMDDVNRRVGSRSECSDSVLGNLLSSCKEFLKKQNTTSVVSYCESIR